MPGSRIGRSRRDVLRAMGMTAAAGLLVNCGGDDDDDDAGGNGGTGRRRRRWWCPRQLPGDTGVGIRVRQPRHDEPVLRPDPVRRRGRLGAARHVVPVDRLGDVRHPRDGRCLRSRHRRQRRRDRRRTRRPRGVQRSDRAGARRGHPCRLLQRRRAEQPDGLRRPGSLRLRVRDGQRIVELVGEGPVGAVHRHARPAQHPAPHRRSDRRDRGIGRDRSRSRTSPPAPSWRRS